MKKYILLNGLSYGFLLNVNNKNYSVKFAGASINKDRSEYSKAHFSTNNKDLQMALESSQLYGKKFVLANSSKGTNIELLGAKSNVLENQNATTQCSPYSTNENTTISNDVSNTPENSLQKLKATNKQAAVEELKTLFPDLQISATAKNNEIEQIANEKGYTFPNLTRPSSVINNGNNN